VTFDLGVWHAWFLAYVDLSWWSLKTRSQFWDETVLIWHWIHLKRGHSSWMHINYTVTYFCLCSSLRWSGRCDLEWGHASCPFSFMLPLQSFTVWTVQLCLKPVTTQFTVAHWSSAAELKQCGIHFALLSGRMLRTTTTALLIIRLVVK